MMKTAARIAAVCLVASAAVFAGSPAHAQDAGAKITLLHGIPATDVDVVANGEKAIAGFKFGDTQDLSALAGKTLGGLKVQLAGKTDVAIDAGDVKLPSSGNVSIIAHLSADGKPMLSVFENDTTALAAGKGRLIVRHTAAAPAVDVKANGAVAFADLANAKEAKADLDAGTVKAEVVPTGKTEPVVIGPADLPIKDGEALIVYAVGSLEGKSLSVLTQTISGLGSAPSEVATGNSPISTGSGSSTGTWLALAMAGTAAIVLGGRKLAAVRAS